LQDDTKINSIRDFYLKAGENINYRQHFCDYFKKNPPSSVEEHAYFAMSILMSSEIQKGKINQFRTFNKGKNILDSLIFEHPNIAEIRYLRFAVQENIPAFLNYDNRIEDKKIIIRNLVSLQHINHTSLKRAMKIVLVNSNQLLDSEKEKVQKYIL
jgi:hypothetical protein